MFNRRLSTWLVKIRSFIKLADGCILLQSYKSIYFIFYLSCIHLITIYWCSRLLWWFTNVNAIIYSPYTGRQQIEICRLFGIVCLNMRYIFCKKEPLVDLEMKLLGDLIQVLEPNYFVIKFSVHPKSWFLLWMTYFSCVLSRPFVSDFVICQLHSIIVNVIAIYISRRQLKYV